MPDYTKQRKSKLIQVCPKCGRKGKKTTGVSTWKGRKEYTLFTHVSEIVTVAGIPFESVKDHCHISGKPQE